MADLNFLSKIKETEQNAAGLVSDAVSNARLMQDNARQQAAEMIRLAREDAATAQQTVLAYAAAQAEKILREAREQTAAAAGSRMAATGDTLENAARTVAERIVSDNAHR